MKLLYFMVHISKNLLRDIYTEVRVFMYVIFLLDTFIFMFLHQLNLDRTLEVEHPMVQK